MQQQQQRRFGRTVFQQMHLEAGRRGQPATSNTDFERQVREGPPGGLIHLKLRFFRAAGSVLQTELYWKRLNRRLDWKGYRD